MKFILTFLKNIVLIITVICTSGLIIASLAPYLNPVNFWLLSIAGLAYLFLLLIVIFFVVFWLIVRIRVAIIPIVGLLLTSPVLFHYVSFGFNKHKPKDEAGSIKVMSYNVRNFDLYNWSNGINTRVNMLKLIANEAPDIACFQEFYTHAGDYYDNVALIKNKVGFKYSHIYLNFGLKDGQKWGIATYTNYPIVDKGVVEFPSPTKNACIYTDININGKIIRVYNVHLQSVRFGRKDYAYIQDVEQNQQLNSRSNYSILSKLKNALLKRAEQAEAIKKHMASSPYPVMLCGDFNDTPVSYAYNTIGGTLHDSFLESGWGIGYSYNGFLPIYRIDYIFHDDNFIAYDYHSERKKYSDHYPVMTKIQMKKSDK